jgi:hypothetical protein
MRQRHVPRKLDLSAASAAGEPAIGRLDGADLAASMDPIAPSDDVRMRILGRVIRRVAKVPAEEPLDPAAEVERPLDRS